MPSESLSQSERSVTDSIRLTFMVSAGRFRFSVCFVFISCRIFSVVFVTFLSQFRSKWVNNHESIPPAPRPSPGGIPESSGSFSDLLIWDSNQSFRMTSPCLDLSPRYSSFSSSSSPLVS